MILEGDGIYLKAGDSHHYKPIDSTSINGARSETKVVEHWRERERERGSSSIVTCISGNKKTISGNLITNGLFGLMENEGE